MELGIVMPATDSGSIAGRRPAVATRPSAAEQRRARHHDSHAEDRRHEAAGEEVALAPPYDAAVEGAVLQSIMLWEPTRPEAMAAVSVDDFYVTAHREVFRACVDMLAAGEAVDYQLVARELERRGILPASEAAQLFISFDGVLYHGPALAREVARLARCRRLLEATSTAAACARRGDEDGALAALREAM